MIAYKFLAEGAVAPFTGFRWPAAGAWVTAPAGRPEVWIHACRSLDLAYWLDEELWRVELGDPVGELRYQIRAPRARLVARVSAWDRATAGEFARACALRARDLALPHVPAAAGDAIAIAGADLEAIAAAAAKVEGSREAGFVGDAAVHALRAGPATTAYIAATLASSVGGGLEGFEAERSWQSSWLAERLAL